MKQRSLWLGFAFGLAYGLGMRLFYGKGTEDGYRELLALMSFGFLFFVPFAIGFITLWPVERARLAQRILAPWVPSVVILAGAAITGFEGAICIVMGLPVVLVMASLGGLAGGLRLAKGRTPALCTLVLPLVLSPLESQLELAPSLHRVETRIAIAAPPEAIWPNVERVRRIGPEENRRDFFQRIGFPRPLEATLSHPGVGGVRTATFEGGVVFIETITAWEAGRMLSFTIDPQTEAVPATTLDEHLVIGGDYFDVLQGTFEIERLPDGGSVLHLTSEYRLSTPFDFYAAPWSDAVMRSIQNNILEVIRARSEG